MIRQGKCKKCGKCCDVVTIFLGNKFLKLVWLRKTWMKIILPHFEYMGFDIDGDMLFQCRYLKNKKCVIYKKRPLLCQRYPTERVYNTDRMIDGCGYYFSD